MAIATNKFRRLMAETFVEKLAELSNIYFFFGRSKPWTDPDAKIGVGTLFLPAGDQTLTITGGNFSGIPEGSTIKNLDTGEVRKVAIFIGDPPTSATVNSEPSVPWTTSNWAWKEPELGSVWKDDNNPPIATGSQYNQNDSAITLLSLKKINNSDMNDNTSYVIKRFDWDETGETMYSPYNDKDGDLLNHPTQNDFDAMDRWNSQNIPNTYNAGSHWVLVHSGSNYHVFKCLDNGRQLGLDALGKRVLLPNKSTAMPDKTQCTPANNYTHVASDGYKWKFMYTLSPDQVLKFLTDNWIPVRAAVSPGIDPGAQNVEQWDVQQLSTPGSIDDIVLTRCDNAVIFCGDTENATTVIPDQSLLVNPLSEIQLPLDASSIGDEYSGCDIFVYETAELKRIVSYDEINKIATIEGTWTTNPVETNSICIAPSVRIRSAFDDYQPGVLASARAVVNLSGYISKILVLNSGSEYRLADVKIVTGTGSNEKLVAFAEALVSPIENVGTSLEGGHGYNAVKELGGYQLMFFNQIKHVEGYANPDNSFDFPQTNDYRVVGMMSNVKNFNGSAFEIEDTLKAIKTLTITTPIGNPNFIEDEVIEFRNPSSEVVARGYVVEYIRDPMDSESGILSFFQDVDSGFDVIDDTLTIRGVSSTATSTIDSIYEREISIFSGDILYIENIKPIKRQPEQLEDIKLVIEF